MPPEPGINVISNTPLACLLPFSLSELELALRVMLEYFPSIQKQDNSLELALMDDAAIAALNVEYLSCSGPTNILSFPSGLTGSLGWLALSVETIRREAMLYKQNLAFYTLKMLGHGLAHLFGHEHGEEMDAQSEKAAAAACSCLAALGSTPCLKCS